MMDLLKIALSQYGVTEIKGDKDNPQIIKYFTDIGFNGNDLKDETAWCSCFINWCAYKAGLERSMALDARSWLSFGYIVSEPEIGDIVIFWRISKSDWRGHVGLFIRQNNSSIWCLGGNQGIGQVNIKAYPKNGAKCGFLGYRRLNGNLK